MSAREGDPHGALDAFARFEDLTAYRILSDYFVEDLGQDPAFASRVDGGRAVPGSP